MNEYKGDQFVPYFTLEKYFENKYLPFIKNKSEFIDYTASYFRIKETEIRFFSGSEWINGQYIKNINMEIHLKNGNYYEIKFFEDGDISIILYLLTSDYFHDKCWRPTGADLKSFIFVNSSKTKNFLNFYRSGENEKQPENREKQGEVEVSRAILFLRLDGRSY